MTEMKTLTVNGQAYTLADTWVRKSLKDLQLSAEGAPMIVGQAMGDPASASDAADRGLLGLTLYGKTTQDGTPAPQEPAAMVNAGDSGSVEVRITGKNLLTLPYVSGGAGYTWKSGGITVVVGEDGSLTISGTAEKDTAFRFLIQDLGETMIPGGTNGTYVCSERVRYTAGVKTASVNFFTGRTYNEVLYPQIEVGTVSTAFEAPKAVQTLSIPTPGGLPGIPVTKGGNYTDAGGQQWICDEIDLARGVYVRRIGTKVFDGTETGWVAYPAKTGVYYIPVPDMVWYNAAPALCTHFVSRDTVASTMYDGQFGKSDVCYFHFYEIADGLEAWKAWLAEQYAAGTPVSMMYVLTEPVETAMDAQTLDTFAALHANRPITTVYNDGHCTAAASYVADTKTYIDNQFTQLQDAILAAGANI